MNIEINNVPDDLSVKTPEQDNQVIDFAMEEKHFVAKWQFEPEKQELHEVTKTHYAMLWTLKEAYPDSKIYNNQNKELTTFKVKCYDDYLQNFSLQYVKGNQNKKRGAMYLVHHWIVKVSLFSEYLFGWMQSQVPIMQLILLLHLDDLQGSTEHF